MEVFGIILLLGGILVCAWGIYVIFRDIILPLYDEKHLQKKYEQDLFEKVRWIAIKSFMGTIGSHRTCKTVRDKDLIEYIWQEEYNLKIDNNYVLKTSDNDFVREILETHKTAVINSLFFDTLKKEKAFYRLNFLEYYMYSLYCFLERNQVDSRESDVIGLFDKMYNIERIENRKIYKFTDNGMSYHKLFYIVTLFCIQNESIKSLGVVFEGDLRVVKERIDNKEMTVLRY